MGFVKEIDGKTSIFQSKCRYVTPKIDRLWKKEYCSEGFSTDIYGGF